MQGLTLLDPTKTFLTSNLGAAEMSSLVSPRLGFHVASSEDAGCNAARESLLVQGTDLRYGARHLKRAIERLLVQPLSNLMASGQIHLGDCIRVSHEDGSATLVFGRELEAVRAWEVIGRAA